MEANKRLFRSKKDKIIGGLCGGIANYFKIDPVIVRLIAVILFFVSGWGFLAYLIGWIIVPKECCATNEDCCKTETKTEEPKTEEPKTEEPKTEEPKTEEKSE